MKRMVVVLAVIGALGFIGNLAKAQTPDWTWAKSAGGTHEDAANSVALDASGNIYVVGYLRSISATFDSYTLTNSYPNYKDVFIAKYNSYGEVLWAKSAGGISYDEAFSVAVDYLGDICVSGYFQSPTITFDSFVLTKTGIGCSDLFLVKYNSNGNVLWAKSEGGTSLEDPYSLSIDKNGNIFITGYFQSSTFTIDSTKLLNKGANDIFLIKYDINGNFKWAKSAGGIQDDEANSVAVDSTGNVYITGFFQSQIINFDSIALTNIGPHEYDVFLAKYDVDGNIIWAKNVGGKNCDVAKSVVIDNIGDIYLSGYFQSDSIFFDSIYLTNVYNSRQMFLAKLDSKGNAIWAKSCSGNSTNVANSLISDKMGNLYVTGSFYGSNIIFDSLTLINASGQVGDIFVIKYNPQGQVLWAKSAGGAYNDEAYSITVDDSYNVFVSGEFFSTSMIFNPISIINIDTNNTSAYYTSDIFLAKLNSITGLNEMINSSSISLFPNPATSSLTITTPQKSSITILNLQGQTIKTLSAAGSQATIDISALAKGMYFVKIETEKDVAVRKFVKE